MQLFDSFFDRFEVLFATKLKMHLATLRMYQNNNPDLGKLCYLRVRNIAILLIHLFIDLKRQKVAN